MRKVFPFFGEKLPIWVRYRKEIWGQIDMLKPVWVEKISRSAPKAESHDSQQRYMLENQMQLHI